MSNENEASLNSSKAFYAIGILNFLHGLSHLIIPVQSFLLASQGFTAHHHHSTLEQITHNPWMGLFWAVVGVCSMYFGYKSHK